MDIVTLSMAKAYSDSKGGYTKPGKILVEVPLEDGIANTENILGLVEGQEYIAYATDRGATENLGTFVAKKGDFNGIPIIYIGELIDGTQFFAFDILEENDTLQGFFVGTKYNSPTTIFRLEQPETIVPIDPKFLPGVTIDLDSYNITDEAGNAMTLGNYLLAKVGAGGGSGMVLGLAKFWEDLNTDSPVTLTQNYGNFNIKIDGVTTAKMPSSGYPAQLSYNMLMVTETLAAMDISVALARSADNAYAVVKVTPLA